MMNAEQNIRDDYMHIAMAADADYAEPMETLMKSVVMSHRGRKIHFYLLHNHAFSEEWFADKNRILSKVGCCITSLDIQEPKEFEGYCSPVIASRTSLYRLLIPQLIRAERVLYLDCDIVVVRDLSEFYDSDFEGNLLAAVPDMGICSGYVMREDSTGGLLPYLNSGVLLFHNAAWQPEDCERLLQTAAANIQAHYGDQDILNIALQGKWKIAGGGSITISSIIL